MIFLGVGWFGFNIFWGMHATSLPLFLNEFTDSKFKISLVLCLAGVAGSVVPPIVGYVSDRTSTRFGRRTPYIFCGGLGVLLCVVGLPHLGTFRTVALLSAVMYFSLRFAETPYLSLLPDITPPTQRSTASGVMNLFGAVGLICYFIAGSMIWEQHQTATFYTTGGTYFILLLIAVSLIKDPRGQIEKAAEEVGGPLKYMKSIMRETNVLKFFGAQFFWWSGFWMVSNFAALFVVEELGLEQSRAFIVLATFSIVAILFVLPLGILGDRLGRKGILIAMVAFWIVSELAVGFSQNLLHALITVGLTAIPFAAVMGVGLAYMLDLIPPDRTAEFVGFSIISVAVAQIVGPLTGGKLIDTVGYRSIFPAAAILMSVGLILLLFVRPRDEMPPAGSG
jgi:MFS family permease